jgi:hypothetical protein
MSGRRNRVKRRAQRSELEAILEAVDKNGKKTVAALDRKYMRT